MNQFQRQVMLKVVAIHVITITLLIVVPLIGGCFQPKKPKEIVTFIEMGAPAASVSMQPVESLPEPQESTPEPEPVVEPESIPEPVPEKIPEPRKEKKKMPDPVKPKPPKKEELKPKKKKDPVKKWKPVSANDIKIGPKTEPDKPTIDTDAIRKRIKQSFGPSGTAPSAGSSSVFDAYDVQIYRLFYEKWIPPASASQNITMRVKIWFLQSGKITKRAEIESSGDPVFDRTVMEAVRSVDYLPKPPRDYPDDNVTLRFKKSN